MEMQQKSLSTSYLLGAESHSVNPNILRFILDFRESEAEDGIQSKRSPGWRRFICPRLSHLLGLSQKLRVSLSIPKCTRCCACMPANTMEMHHKMYYVIVVYSSA